MIPVKRAFIDGHEGQIHYRTAGVGYPLLLIHQASTSSSDFSRVMPILAEKHHTIAPDLPGYGDSDKPSRVYQISDYALAVKDFLDSIGVSKANVIGQHAGANIAVELAVTYPNCVDKLVLSGLPLQRELNLPLPEFMKPWQIKNDGSHLMRVWDVVKSWGNRAPPEILQELALDYFKAGPENEDLHQASWNYLPLPKLPLIKNPTLVISGSKDLFISDVDEIQRSIPHSRKLIIEGPGTGPLMMRRKPELFAQAVLDFLKIPSEEMSNRVEKIFEV